MSKSFGFDEVIEDFGRYEENATQAELTLVNNGEKMRDRARAIAASKGLVKSGKGISGIEIEKKIDEVDVGWSDRPRFHLYFHEIGFHALDNRRKKSYRLKRNKNRQRMYTNTKATYIAPKPHLRPAFDELENEFYKSMQDTLEKGV